jgi:hypothetical protein
MMTSRLHFSLRNCISLATVLLLGIGVLLSSFMARAEQPAATYQHGSLSVTIPYDSPQAGAGKLIVEILDPEDHSLGRVECNVEIRKGSGSWQQQIALAQPMPLAEILWQRIRYRFVFDDAKRPPIEGIESISQIIRRPVVHILGEKEYIAGSTAAIRVIVSEANSNAALTGSLRIELLASNQEPQLLFSGNLNRRSTVEAGFRFPAKLIGSYELRFSVDTPIGSAVATQPVQLKDKVSILLTTEKPIYQPGQSIHARALALDRAASHAAANRKLTFEVEDSRGNKVFRKVTETDKFGIASAEFTLADEVNLGAYHLRALMGESAAPANTAEITLQVARYVLPKFKVAIEFTAKDNKPKRDYRPGEAVTGTVRANYFFGKPVSDAEISLKATGMDVAVFEAASAKGTTDKDGAYHFDLKLPAFFAGHPLSQGAARALIEATVKDSAAHEETRGEAITISEQPLLITAIPESGALIPSIENDIFILASYPDGTPARATLTVHRISASASIEGQDIQLSTDSSGIALLRLDPGAGHHAHTINLRIEADDHRGNRATSTVPLQTRGGAEQILLHTNRAVFKTGDRIQLKVLSTRAHGAAYVDIVKNGQTILTRDLDLDNGQAELTLNATPEMAGTLDIDAYLFGRDAQPVADHRLVFVQPADELKIETTADAPEYRPGGEARVKFHVTNAHGEGVQAALGLQVVDEAVFALAEKNPGFAKTFFYLEQEGLKPRYEIHSLSMNDVVESGDASKIEAQNLAARALFSATEMANPAKLDVEFGRALPQEKFEDYQQRYRAAFEDQVHQISDKLSQKIAEQHASAEIVKAFAVLENGAPPRDAWGTPLRIEPYGRYGQWKHLYLVRSAGQDRSFDSADDLTVYIEDRTGTVVDDVNQGGSFNLHIDHDRGPDNGRAEIAGAVTDATGAVISNATITLHPLSTGNTRTTHSDASGHFNFAGLPAGRYQIKISSPGFEVLIDKSVSLEPRDLATISATLSIGSETETVTVNADVNANANLIELQTKNRAVATEANAVNFGAAGGVVGGIFGASPAPVRISAGAKADKLKANFAVTNIEPSTPDAPHIRSYFPEALYINPEILTDGNGNASISIPIADSITTWRMAMLASTETGALGSASSNLKVFQDFFVDLDLPVTLTQGDRVSIPVAIYNYTGKRGDVKLQLQPDDWFSLDNGTLNKTVSTESGQTGSAQFTLNANRIGKFRLTLTARMEGARGVKAREDVVVREIEVIPNGREQNIVFNGRLDTSERRELAFPAASIPDATSILVRLYPGPLSQIVESMDSILRMPYGCFEQTSSSTYPNVLALDYMKRTKKLTPEIHAKADGYIANGYQRLLTFEVPGGGFSWFGQAPANKILTAYGLMEFNDMSKVSDVDPRLIERTGAWLARQQQPDGSWKHDTYFINEGATNRFNSDTLRITAYIAWSLENIGYSGSAIEKAKHFIESYTGSNPDTYTLAVIANFAADYGKDREFTQRSMQALIDARTEQGDLASWNAEETGVYSTGQSAAIETTGLATQALLKWGQASETARKALNYLSSKKQAAGNWGTTQATIMALRALLLATQMSASDVNGTLEISLDDKPVETLKLNAENNDLLHQFSFKNIDARKPASVALNFSGTGTLAYQIVGRYFTPWHEKPAAEALSIDVAYDRTRLAQNDIATATATIRNNLSKTAKMVMVDLGIPPGFELLSEDLQSFQDKTRGQEGGRLEKFSLTATQAILYFNALSQKQTVTLSFRLRAKYPIRARTFPSRVYEYYDPEVNATAHPVQLEVTEHLQ